MSVKGNERERRVREGKEDEGSLRGNMLRGLGVCVYWTGDWYRRGGEVRTTEGKERAHEGRQVGR